MARRSRTAAVARWPGADGASEQDRGMTAFAQSGGGVGGPQLRGRRRSGGASGEEIQEVDWW
uniref:DUF834 domain-containing protein n=1 Tax=Oryza brachyantha TaxID=4533 RepID=J3MH87_ORYBR